MVSVETVAATPDFYGWDWSATTHDSSDGCVDTVLSKLGAKNVVPGKGLQGWSQSVQAFDGDGYALGSVYFGGGRDDIHVVSTSGVADSSRRLVSDYANARTARVDTRVDTLLPFEDLEAILTEAADTYGARIVTMESKERGVSMGRTIYLGAPSSRIRVRTYEKWLESPGQYVEGTNRVEVQLRPHSQAKAAVSQWTRAETFCASKTTRDLAHRLGDVFAPTVTLRLERQKPELEETLRSMGKQYGNAVAKFLELSGGDIGRVVSYLTDEDQTDTNTLQNGRHYWQDTTATMNLDAEVPF